MTACSQRLHNIAWIFCSHASHKDLVVPQQGTGASVDCFTPSAHRLSIPQAEVLDTLLGCKPLPAARQLAEKLATIDLGPLLYQLGGSTDATRAQVRELKRFLILKAISKDGEGGAELMLSPSWAVDQAWHKLMLQPRLYLSVCRALGSADVIDHNPLGAQVRRTCHCAAFSSLPSVRLAVLVVNRWSLSRLLCAPARRRTAAPSASSALGGYTSSHSEPSRPLRSGRRELLPLRWQQRLRQL